jgi:hypothetical protein
MQIGALDLQGVREGPYHRIAGEGIATGLSGLLRRQKGVPNRDIVDNLIGHCELSAIQGQEY